MHSVYPSRVSFQKPIVFTYSYKNLEAYPGLLRDFIHLCSTGIIMFSGAVSEIYYHPRGINDYAYSAWLLKTEDGVRAFNTEKEAKHMRMLLSLGDPHQHLNGYMKTLEKD